MMTELTIGDKAYPVLEVVTIGDVGIPLVDIPMMSDERWNEHVQACKERLGDRYDAIVNIIE